jgi:hypothetical protein
VDKLLVAISLTLSAAIVPSRAFASDARSSDGPAKLTDAQLDEVVAGVGPPAFVLAAGHGPPFMRNQDPAQATALVNFLIKDVQFTFNVGPNSPVNMATVFQFSLLSQPIQSGSATALQTGGH